MAELPDACDDIVEAVTDVLGEYPVECGVLYGSLVEGAARSDSDVDVAVGFEPGVSAPERLQYRIELTVELSKRLDTDAVDVADLDRLRPEVGLSAVETGIALVGDESVLDSYRERFEGETGEETHEERMRRFDAVLENLEGRV